MSILRKTLLAEDRELAASYEDHAPKRKLALMLRSLRKRAALTQAQVAARSGLTQSHISKMESAAGPMPTIDSFNRYAKACGAELCISFPEKGKVREQLRHHDEPVCALL